MKFKCPHEGEATRLSLDGISYFLTLSRADDGRLLAIITEGHPNAGDGSTVVCSLEVVKGRKDAAAWFEKSLAEKPWQPRN